MSTFIAFALILAVQSVGVFAQSQTKELNCSKYLTPQHTDSMAETPETLQAVPSSIGNEDYTKAQSVYDFSVKDTYGNDVSLEKYRGHVLLIVNIASQCGLTKNNYAKLTQLNKDYHDKGLRILAFPCNQFGSQMPEHDGEEMVCHLKNQEADIGDVFAKVNVNGNNVIPLYKYLKEKQSGIFGSLIKWNFTKFLVDKNGIPVDRFAPTTDPMDIAKEIEKYL